MPKQYDERHGGPYDRGGADAYYERPYAPHYYEGATGATPRIEAAGMTRAQIAAYRAGYRAQAASGVTKDWGY